MLPFFLLVSVTLLALYRFLGSAGTTTIPFVCAEDSVRYSVKSGDSCWAIANDHGITVADLIKLNQDVDCNLLQAGRDICVPVLK
jgi:LysM repeat protein